MVVLDALIVCFLLGGAVLGYFRGAFAGVVLLLLTYIPFFIFIFFYDFISGFVDDVIGNTSDSTTAAIGALGAFSGLIAVIGFVGGMFFITRLVSKLLRVEKLDLADKIGGALVGLVGQTIAATLTFFLIYTAIPTTTALYVKDNYWVKIMRPLHRATYPYYLALMQQRTQKLSLSIAQNGLSGTVLGGVTLNSLNEGLGFDAPDVGAVGKALENLSDNINLEEITNLLETANTQDVSAEAIDRTVREEQARRLNIIQGQLQ